MTIAKARRAQTRVAYGEDILLWSKQQAQALREARFADLDIEHLADEIEDVGKAEKRELASRMAVLLGHLLKWRFQPNKRSKSWRTTIGLQRRRVGLAVKATPSLKALMRDEYWREAVWLDAVALAAKETGRPEDDFPDAPSWPFEKACEPDFWPD
jgi:hypothetical protein